MTSAERPLLVVTDVDSTLIAQEVIDELAAFAGVGDDVARITERAMNGELDFAASLRARVAALAGVPRSAFAAVLDSLDVTPGAPDLIGAVHRAGGVFGVVSGGFEEVIAPLCRRLGIDHWCANRLEVRDGTLTGRLVGEIVTADVKAERLGRWARLHGIDPARTAAIGDGANDIAMMSAAGTGIAFCAKPAVRERVPYRVDVRRLDVLIEPLGLSG
ncbi:phosphoserine phosphatase SerB [Actinomyces sp. B33]|nr:phosphoserine phosphatase SerB [Actinomyces sp. B33]MDC4233209.1 phosphoserine phosphatase SerB [Actinomyces sp. B33]